MKLYNLVTTPNNPQWASQLACMMQYELIFMKGILHNQSLPSVGIEKMKKCGKRKATSANWGASTNNKAVAGKLDRETTITETSLADALAGPIPNFSVSAGLTCSSEGGIVHTQQDNKRKSRAPMSHIVISCTCIQHSRNT